MTQTHLICLRKPSDELIGKIKEEWPNSYELNSSQVLVHGPINGGKTVYERVNDLGSENVAALVMVVNAGTFHGRHSTSLWDWLEENVGF